MSGARSSSAETAAGRAALLALPSVWAVVLLLLPMAVLVAMSTGSKPEGVSVRYDGSFEAYRWLAEESGRVGSVAWRSARIAGLATIFSLLLATPVAWWIAGLPQRKRAMALLLVVLPSWTSFLLRTYAWRFLFGNEGPVNGWLESLSLGSVKFLNTETAVVVGLVYGYLPFAVLPIYVAVERVDRDLLAAARDLGAGPVATFASVAFPLTLSGTLAAAALVFVPSFAAFVTPRVLGGADTYMIGQMTQDAYFQGRNWPKCAVLGVAIAAAAFLALLPLRRKDPARA